MNHQSLFDPCPDWYGITPESTHDCAECRANVHGRACPKFHQRFIRMLFPGIQPHQMRFLLNLRLHH